MTLQLMLSRPFPIDILLLLGVACVAGFAWAIGARIAGRLP